MNIIFGKFNIKMSSSSTNTYIEMMLSTVESVSVILLN